MTGCGLHFTHEMVPLHHSCYDAGGSCNMNLRHCISLYIASVGENKWRVLSSYLLRTAMIKKYGHITYSWFSIKHLQSLIAA